MDTSTSPAPARVSSAASCADGTAITRSLFRITRSRSSGGWPGRHPTGRRLPLLGRVHGSKHLGQECFGPLVLGIGQYLARIARLDDDATVHEYQLVGDLSSKAHLVRHDDHRHPASGELLHDVEDL